MRTVIRTGPGEVQFNWMWLPTWIGMNTHLKREIEENIGKKLIGQPLDEATLDMANEEVIDFLDKRYPGFELREYLDSLKFVPSA
jgi:hypothetical protein